MMVEDVLTWNVGPRRPFRVVPSLARVLRHLRRREGVIPDEIALFEATHCEELLRRVFGKRWRVICPEGSDVVLMTPREEPRPDVELVRHNARWTGPKMGKPKRGRGHLFVDDERLYVHRVTGGPSGGRRTNNEDAWAVEDELIEDVLAPLKSAFCAGDQNARKTELADLWRSLGMAIVWTRAKVDHAAAKGWKWTAQMLPRFFGSDHRPILYRRVRRDAA